METTPAPSAPRTDHDERQTWRSLLLGSVVWFVYLNLVYGVASLSCKWNWFAANQPGPSRLLLVETLLTLLALPLLLVFIYLPWRDWRRFQTKRPPDNPHLLEDTEKDRRPLVAFITMLLNGLYFLFALATLVPVFALSPCA
jgi:hypothetical protein